MGIMENKMETTIQIHFWSRSAGTDLVDATN